MSEEIELKKRTPEERETYFLGKIIEIQRKNTILRHALKDIKSSYHESGAGKHHAPHDYSIELCREIASEAIAEADEIKDGPDTTEDNNLDKPKRLG